MNNRQHWKPSKYVYIDEKLKASRDPAEVGIGSRLNADIVASYFDENLKKYANGKLLDLGCGSAPLFEAYDRFVTDTVCADWDNTVHDNRFLDLCCDLTKNLPFDNESFDTIILSDVLEHMPEPEKLFSEMSRILRKNGKIIISVPFYYWLHEQPYDYYRYTEFALRRFAKRSDLSVEYLTPMGGVPEIMGDLLAKYFIIQFSWGWRVSIAVQNFVSFFISTKIGKRASKKTCLNFPIGYFVVLHK